MRVLHLLGDASYSIYLSQVLGVSAFAIVWRKLGLSTVALGPQIGFVATGVIAISAIGILLHLTVEMPMTRWLYGTMPRKRASALVAGMTK